jgi:hypothetical protein
MYDKIKSSAIADGIPEEWADLIVYTYRDVKKADMAALIGRDFFTTKNMLAALYKHLGVKTKSQLMYKCAPYIKGEKVCGS